AGGAAGLFIFFLPAEFFRAELQFLLADLGRLVLDAELDGIEVHLHREFVHDRFDAERGGRTGRGAEGAGGAGIDGDGGLLGTEIRDLVKIRRAERDAAAAAFAGTAGADAGRAVVVHFKRVQRAVGFRAEFQLLKTGRPVAD